MIKFKPLSLLIFKSGLGEDIRLLVVSLGFVFIGFFIIIFGKPADFILGFIEVVIGGFAVGIISWHIKTHYQSPFRLYVQGIYLYEPYNELIKWQAIQHMELVLQQAYIRLQTLRRDKRIYQLDPAAKPLSIVVFQCVEIPIDCAGLNLKPASIFNLMQQLHDQQLSQMQH
jgi:hypothetical protein